jgi:hypothetical protein
LIANGLTMIIVIIAAIRRPTWRYRVLGLVALCAFMATLHQVVTARFTVTALLLTTLLVIFITVCAVQNVLTLRKR